MLNFPALVHRGLANSPRKGPSLALLVMLIINKHSAETGVSTARGAAIASLCHPSLCHRCFTNLVLTWDVQECTAAGLYQGWVSRCLPSALGVRSWPVPALTCLARWSREIRSQQRGVAVLSSAEEFVGVWRAGSVAGVQGTGNIGESCPYSVMKGKENFAGRWRLQSGLSCTQLQLQTSVGLVLPGFFIADMFVCIETFVETIAEMWSCAKLCNIEMKQAGAFPFPTMAWAWRRSKVGDVTVFSTVAVLWINPLCSNAQEPRTDLAGVSMSSTS